MSADDSGFDYWNTFLAALAAWAGIAASLLVACWRWVVFGAARAGMLWRGLLLASHVADRWGDESGSGFREEIESLQGAVRELRIRLSVAESKVGLGTFTTDAAGNLIWANSHTVSLFGRDSQNILGRHWITAVSDESRERIASVMRLCCGERIPAHCTVMVVETGRQLRLDIRPIIDDAQKIEWLSCELSEPK